MRLGKSGAAEDKAAAADVKREALASAEVAALAEGVGTALDWFKQQLVSGLGCSSHSTWTDRDRER
jgi:hypothetical protein